MPIRTPQSKSHPRRTIVPIALHCDRPSLSGAAKCTPGRVGKCAPSHVRTHPQARPPRTTCGAHPRANEGVDPWPTSVTDDVSGGRRGARGESTRMRVDRLTPHLEFGAISHNTREKMFTFPLGLCCPELQKKKRNKTEQLPKNPMHRYTPLTRLVLFTNPKAVARNL